MYSAMRPRYSANAAGCKAGRTGSSPFPAQSDGQDRHPRQKEAQHAGQTKQFFSPSCVAMAARPGHRAGNLSVTAWSARKTVSCAWTSRPARCRSAANAVPELVCRAAVDEREAYHREIGDLETRVDRLEQRIAELEGNAGIRPNAAVAQRGRRISSSRSIKWNAFFRRFLGVVREFDQEPAPDRT